MNKVIDVLVIGNGVAGNNAATAAKRRNPSLSVAIIGKEAHSEYAAPALPDYLSGELDKEGLLVKHIADYGKEGIELFLNKEVERIDPDNKKVFDKSGDIYRYRKLVIATGSLPIQLRRMKGTDMQGNFVLKTIDDVDSILRYSGDRAVVVGSGAIGLEGGMGLKERGYKEVTIVEALEWISMKSLDRITADLVVKELENNGINVLQGESVVCVEGEDRVKAVKTSKRIIPCDIVLWGIGVRPNTALAQKAGIELGELGGILVDEYMRTNIPDIYACGDCVESVDQISGKRALNLFWEPAARGGMTAGLNCAGGDKLEFNGSMAVFLTHIGDVPVVAFGKTAEKLKHRNIRILDDRRKGSFRRVIMIGNRILGAQMVGTLENVNGLLNIMRKNAELDTEDLMNNSGKYAALPYSVSAYINQLKKKHT